MAVRVYRHADAAVAQLALYIGQAFAGGQCSWGCGDQNVGPVDPGGNGPGDEKDGFLPASRQIEPRFTSRTLHPGWAGQGHHGESSEPGAPSKEPVGASR